MKTTRKEIYRKVIAKYRVLHWLRSIRNEQRKARKVCERWENYIITTIIRNAKEWLNVLHMNCTRRLITNKAACNMFCVMLLLFGAVLFISGTDIERIREFNQIEFKIMKREMKDIRMAIQLMCWLYDLCNYVFG